MKTIITSIILSIVSLVACGQELSESPKSTKHMDRLSFGIRSTQSLFGSMGYSGMGFGGQFRIRVNDKLNTEWFADHIKTDLGGLGHRETAHIGWSVMFYPFNSVVRKGAFLPYVLAGHCFDFAKINGYQHQGMSEVNTEFETKRWSSAVQIGLGTSYHLTDQFDLSFSAQYMRHLGNELEVSEALINIPEIGPHLQNNSNTENLGLEGHLLLTLSLNYILIRKS